MPPDEKLVNVIVCGAQPEVIFVLKNEITLFFFTFITFTIESLPHELDTINLT